MSDLWTGNGEHDLDFVGAKPARSAGRARTNGAFFGCPLSWIKKVAPLVHGKGELLVAIYLWRLRVVTRSKMIVLGNSRLLDELGIDRFTKSRTLRRLERAGLIRVRLKPGQAPRVAFLDR